MKLENGIYQGAIPKTKGGKRYNSSMVPSKFEEGDLVLRRANIGQPIPGHEKLAGN